MKLKTACNPKQQQILSDANNNKTDRAKKSNNNTKETMANGPNKKNNEKYSLRQRQKRSATGSSSKYNTKLSNTNCSATDSSFCDLSDFESLPPETKKQKEKPKPKAAPLSKYRRKTANARERTRMREINSAFENLRQCVPQSVAAIGTQSTPTNEKLTKITTLRLAMSYINMLTDALTNPDSNVDFLNDDAIRNEIDNDQSSNSGSYDDDEKSFVNESPPNATTLSSRKLKSRSTASTDQKSGARSRSSTGKAPAKRQRSTKQKLDELSSPYSISSPSSPTTSSYKTSTCSSSSSSSSSSYLCDENPNAMDLNGIMLESDGESLHLSESCLSPLSSHYSYHHHKLMIKPFDCFNNKLSSSPTDSSLAADSSLELSLSLLESDNDSLEFATDQQPSSCISPLVTLDTFNPFSDLLHSEFPEHTSLDLYLT